MRENAITGDDEDILTGFFTAYHLDCAHVEEVLGTVLGIS